MDYALQAMLHGGELACISSAEVLTAAALGALGGMNIVNLLSHMKYLDDLVKLTRVTKSALKQFGRSVDELSASASQPINNTGLTRAARALDKHAAGQRSTGTFPAL